MNKRPTNNESPIRRISKDEKLAKNSFRREWPDKKYRSSEQVIPEPQPGEKNRIHSVLVALPVLMLVIGLFVYFRGESAQNNGAPVLSELVSREGVFKSVSTVSGIGTAKHYLWYVDGERSRGVRITFVQAEQLQTLLKGDELNLELAPRVAGSTTLWAYRIKHEGDFIVDATAR